MRDLNSGRENRLFDTYDLEDPKVMLLISLGDFGTCRIQLTQDQTPKDIENIY